MAAARKFMKKCTRAGISKKECKAISARRTALGKKPAKIKSCKMSDPTVKRTAAWMRSLNHAARSGDGSGAEDRFSYDLNDLTKLVKGRCGAKFAKKLRKNALK